MADVVADLVDYFGLKDVGRPAKIRFPEETPLDEDKFITEYEIKFDFDHPLELYLSA